MPKVLTDYEVGAISDRIKRAKRGANLAALAREFKVSDHTLRAIRDGGMNWRAFLKRKKPRQTTERRKKLKKRAKRCMELARRVKKQSDSRKIPAFPTAKSIAKQLAIEGYGNISCRTVMRDLCSVGMHCFVRPLRSFNLNKHAPARLKFAQQALFKGQAALAVFRSLVFSDEVWFDGNDHSSRTQWAFRSSDTITRERQNEYNVSRVMVFAAVGVGYKSELIFIDGEKDEEGKTVRLNAQRYINLCLKKIKPDLVRNGRRFVQDNAKAHTAKIVTEYLEKQGVDVVGGWPSTSPDLNPIETVWALMKKKVSDLGHAQTREQLIALLKQAWAALDQNVIDNCCLSFERKLRDVRLTRGLRQVA